MTKERLAIVKRRTTTLKNICKMANDNLEQNYKKIWEIVDIFNSKNEDSDHIFLCDLDNGLMIEDEYFYFD